MSFFSRVVWGVCLSLTVDHASCGSRQGGMGCVLSLTVDHASCGSRQGGMGCVLSLTVDHASCGSRQGGMGCVLALTVDHASCGSRQGGMGCVLALTVDHASCGSRQGGMGCVLALTVDHASCGSRQGAEGGMGSEWFCLSTVWEYNFILGERCQDNYSFLVLYQTRRRRSIQSNREKRKRYRANRKLRKTYTDSATGQSVTFESEQENSVSRSDTCSESTSFHPGSDRWDTLMDQAELSRILQENKRIELENQYGNFVDESPSFPVDERKVILPDSLRGLDRVEVGAQISDILKKENKALSQARFFRNCCAHLKMRIRELENEKEGIRFFGVTR